MTRIIRTRNIGIEEVKERRKAQELIEALRSSGRCISAADIERSERKARIEMQELADHINKRNIAK